MKKITKITKQQKGDRYNLFLDEEFFCGITEDTLIKCQLKKGLEVDEVHLAAVLREEMNNKCFQYAVFLLGKRNYFEKVLRDKLKEKEYDEEAIGIAIERLYQYRYLDDSRLAEAFVKDKKNFSKKGPSYIRSALKAKGVKEEQISVALENAYAEEEALENCKELAAKKLPYYAKKAESSYILKGKLYAFLAQRGYQSDVIKKAIEEVMSLAQEE